MTIVIAPLQRTGNSSPHAMAHGEWHKRRAAQKGFRRRGAEMIIELNQRGFEHAKQLIREGRAVADERGDWRDHRPDADKEEAYMLVMGAERYGDWHLGIDDEQPEGSKERYHYLVGDFSDLHRCALFEIEDVADNFFYGDIEIAAATLISLLGAHAPKSNAPAEGS